MKSKILLIISMVLASQGVLAGTANVEKMIASMKFEKMQAEVMINRLAKSGRLSDEEASRAKREIASVQEESREELRAGALENINTANSFANK